MHDFKDEGLGEEIPYRPYDLAASKGWTARRWSERLGSRAIRTFGAVAVVLATVGNAEQHKVVITTQIDQGTVQAGLKSTQTVVVDLATHRAESDHWTGLTEIGPMKFASVDDKFEATASGNASGGTTVEIKGRTRSGVRFMPPIDYRMKLVSSSNGAFLLTGCHDEFPSYNVTINGEEVYDYPHPKIDGLAGYAGLPYLLQGCRESVYREGGTSEVTEVFQLDRLSQASREIPETHKLPKVDAAALAPQASVTPDTYKRKAEGRNATPNSPSSRATVLEAGARRRLNAQRNDVKSAIEGAYDLEEDSRDAARRALEDIDTLRTPRRRSDARPVDSVDLGESDDLGKL